MMELEQRLMVYMLGGFELYYEGAPIQLKKKLTSKPLMLLQLLLYHRETGVSRHAVIEALYGQETEIDASNSLNATVSQLRRILKETRLPQENYIHVRMERNYFESSFLTWVDTEEAKALRQEADLTSGEQRLELLYQICDLYHGRFLPELDGETWAEIARADCQRLYRDSLEEICRTLKERGAYDEILRLTGIAAKQFPFDEWQVWQQECLVSQGRIKEAYDLYRQVEKLYMTELDAPPPERMRSRFRNSEKEPWRQTENIGSVRKWLRDSNQEGPYCIPFPSFLYVYNLITKLSSITDTPFCLLLCTLSNSDGRTNPTAKEFHTAMEELESVLEKSLRWEDVFTRYSRSQFLVTLLGAPEENSGVVADRIEQRFRELIGERKLRLECQLMRAEELLAQKRQPET
jgi:DNA-binding SARP family transcriptional activator